MKRLRNISSTMLLLAGLVLQGCSGNSEPAKEIAPGAFVLDEPIELTRGELKESSRCYVDTVNGKSSTKKGSWAVKRGEEIVFRGWAYSRDGSTAANPLFIRLNGAVQTYYAVSSARSVRADVNSSMNLPAELASGYELRASIAQMEPGLYSIMIMQPFGDRVEGCERPYTLIVD